MVAENAEQEGENIGADVNTVSQQAAGGGSEWGAIS
jgi:hypothetical protein